MSRKTSKQNLTPSASQIIKNQEKFMLYDEREHLKHPIPRPMEINVVGQKLTDIEWQKFCERTLKENKYLEWCERRGNGSLIFFGESGIDAAVELHKKFPERFHFTMACIDKDRAKVAIALALAKELPLMEVSFQKTRNDRENINDPDKIRRLATSGENGNLNVKLA